MTSIDINNREVVVLANKLEKMHRSAFPSTVRNTLNDMAFDVKTRTLEKSASKAFIRRDKRFFKAFSSVKKAKGFNTKSMFSEVGMIDKGASADMDKQEKGGTVSKRSLIPMDPSRTGRNKGKKVRKKAHISRINVKKKVSKDKKQQFMVTVKTVGEGGHFIYGNILFEIKSIRKKIKLVPLYSVKKGRNVKLKSRPFVRPAALESGKKGAVFFRKNAEFQFKKFK